jgi:RNA polymerase sigma-70 factor (ECF subfamily)
LATETAAALATLNPDHREVLLLIVIEGLAYEAAAEILEIAIGTLRSRLSRARESLRHQLSVKRPRVEREERLDVSDARQIAGHERDTILGVEV